MCDQTADVASLDQCLWKTAHRSRCASLNMCLRFDISSEAPTVLRTAVTCFRENRARYPDPNVAVVKNGLSVVPQHLFHTLIEAIPILLNEVHL